MKWLTLLDALLTTVRSFSLGRQIATPLNAESDSDYYAFHQSPWCHMVVSLKTCNINCKGRAGLTLVLIFSGAGSVQQGRENSDPLPNPWAPNSGGTGTSATTTGTSTTTTSTPSFTSGLLGAQGIKTIFSQKASFRVNI